MKNTYLFRIISILLCSVALLSSCEKEKQLQLPPETQTGQNTIGFKVDGKIYTASGIYNPLADDHVRVIAYQDSTIVIFASNENQHFHFEVQFRYIGLNVFSVVKSFPYQAKFQDTSDGTLTSTSNEFVTDDTHQGKFLLKYYNRQSPPPSNLAGTFEFEAVNGQGKIIHITEGRFDIAQR